MELPGTIHERIGDLRSCKEWSQKKLAGMIKIAPSQLSRIENGETVHISSDILIKLANVFEVSTDYILGLTNVRTRKSYEISELGLSDGAVRTLVSRSTEVQMLNRLLEHKSFPRLLQLMKIYFEDTAAAGIMARNSVIDFATATADDFRKENPEHKADIQKDIRLINAQKIGEHEAEIEKIKNMFMAVLKDIKRDIDAGEMPGAPATAEFTQQIMEQAQALQREKGAVTAEDMAVVIANVAGQAVPMDEETAAQFKRLAERILQQQGKQQ